MSDAAAREILVAGAAALAHTDDLGSALRMLLGALAPELGVESAAILTIDPQLGRLGIAASIGLDDQAVAGLGAAVADPGHPIARTMASPVPTFDVLPTRPGGPALRAHLPLIVRRNGADIVLGVLALAYERPMEIEQRQLLLAGADLAAVAVERQRTG